MPKRTFKVGDDIYDIEESESASFLKDMPDAKEVKSFTVGKDTFDIDINDVDAFLTDMPDAKPINGQKKSEDQTKSKPISFGYSTPGEATQSKPLAAPSPSIKNISQSKLPSLLSPKDLVSKIKQYAEQPNTAADDSPEVQEYVSRLGDRAIRGVNSLNSMLAKTPEFIYNVAAVPQNVIAGQFDIPELATNAEKIKKDLGITNEIAQHYDNEVKALAYLDDKYAKQEGSIVKLIESGKYGDAAKLLGEQIVESLPTTAAIAASGGLGATPTAITLAGGAVFGAGKYDELKDRTDLSEAQKTSIALGTGLVEGLFENIGTANLGRVVKDLLVKEGGEVAAKNLFVDTYKEALKKYMPISGVVSEGLEEAGTQFVQNAIDIYGGVDPDKKITDGVMDAFIVGAGSGGVISSPSLLSKKRNAEATKKEAEISNLENDISSESTSPEVKQALTTARQGKMEELNNIIAKDVSEQKTLSDVAKREIETLHEQKSEIESALQSDISEESKIALADRSEKIDEQIEQIVKQQKDETKKEAAIETETAKAGDNLSNIDPSLSATAGAEKLTPRAQGVLENSLAEYESATPKQKTKMVEKVKSELDRNKKGIEAIGMGLDDDMVAAGTEFLKQIGYDKENIAGLPSDVRKGEEPIKAEPIERTGSEKAGANRVVQTPFEEVINKTAGEVDIDNLTEESTIPAIEMRAKEQGIKISDDEREMVYDALQQKIEHNPDRIVSELLDETLSEYKSIESTERPKPEPTKAERKKIAEAKIDEVAQALKDFLPSAKGVSKSGLGQDEIIDAVASAVKALVNAGIEINEAIKQVKAKLSEHFDVSELNDKDIKAKVAPSTQDKIESLEKELAAAKSESKKKVLQEKIDELKAPAPKRKERRLTKQILADPNISDEFKASISEDEIYYQELPNKVTLDEANAIIDYLGEDAARREVSNMANGMRLPVRNTIAQVLIKRYEKQGDYEAAIDVREELVTSATEQGQGVQSFAMWPSLSPEGEVIKMQREITKQREKKKAQAKPVTDKITKGLKQANKEAAEEAVAKVQKKVDKSSEIEPTDKKRSADYGSQNKVVTKSQYEAAKKAMRGKMFSAVITPELIAMGTYHIEAGSRKFADFADAMIDDLGKKVIPYLRDIYNNAKTNFEDVSDDSEIDMYYGAIDGAKWKEKLEKAIAKGDKKAAAEAMDALKKIGTDEGLWGKYRDSAVNRLKNIPLEKVAGEIKENPALQDFTNGLIRNMEEKIAEGVAGEEAKGEPKKQRKAIEIIGDAFKNIEKYEEVWDKTQAEFVEKYKDNPEVLEALDEHFGQILDKPFSKKSVAKAVKQGLVDMNKKISDIVVQHYTVQDYAKQSLANRLVKEAGLTGAEAKTLADAVKEEFDKIATAKKQQIIEKSLGKKEKKSTERKSLEEELIRLTNVGAFSNEDVVKAYGDKMGWPKMTPVQVQEIERLAAAVQEAPEGFKRFRAVEDLLSYQASIPGVSFTDVAMSIWYANVLSGQNTQLVNVVGNMANSAALYANAALQNPTAAGFIANGFIQGFRKGLLEAKATWATGYSPIRGKVEVPATLERTMFWGGNLNPASYLKYVRRLMVASDVIIFESQKEMRAYQLAWKQAAKKEMLEPNQSQRDAALDILDKTDETVELSKIEAAEEYAEEVEAINNSSLSDSEKAAKIKQAKQDEKRRVYELVEQKRSGTIKEDSASFAARGTYNYKPEGLLGVFANQMNNLKSLLGRSADEQTKAIPKIGAKTLNMAMNFIVPFTNIIANVANESLNYTLIGTGRALAGGSLTGQRKTPLTDQEKIDMHTKAIIGTSLMAAAYLLATMPNGDDDEPLIEITANGTGNYKDNYELKRNGWQPYSIKVGGKWISYQYTPLMLGLSLIGNIKDREKYHEEKSSEESFLQKVSMASRWSSLALMDMTFLATLNKTLSTIADPRNEDAFLDFQKQGIAIAKGFVVPALYTQSAQKVEEIMNIPTKEIRGTMLGDFLKDIPGARNAYYDKIDGLGDPIVVDTDKVFSSAPSNQDPETTKLWQLIADKSAFIGGLNLKTERVYDAAIGKERAMTQEEFYNVSIERGKIIKADLKKRYDKLKSMPGKDVREYMGELKADATDEAKAKLFKPQ